jgi:hypothetical protein
MNEIIGTVKVVWPEIPVVEPLVQAFRTEIKMKLIGIYFQNYFRFFTRLWD